MLSWEINGLVCVVLTASHFELTFSPKILQCSFCCLDFLWVCTTHGFVWKTLWLIQWDVCILFGCCCFFSYQSEVRSLMKSYGYLICGMSSILLLKRVAFKQIKIVDLLWSSSTVMTIGIFSAHWKCTFSWFFNSSCFWSSIEIRDLTEDDLK